MTNIQIIKRPIINEKYSKMNEQGIYAFEVEKSANKIHIRAAIEQMFGVTVRRVNTLNVRGKSKSRFQKGRQSSGMTPSYKKAIVFLNKDQVIDFYANI
jgi:large subunit ribosomal protein L23